MKNTIFYLLFLCTICTSCSGIFDNKPENLSLSKDFQLIEINEQYSLNVPKYMTEAEDLNDEASLQYQNIIREAYVIVIDEPKNEFVESFKLLDQYADSLSVVENYCAIQLSYIMASTSVTNESKQKKHLIRGLEAVTKTFQGTIEDIDDEIAYHLTFIEGKENLYMVMSWTLKSKQEKYYPTYDQIASTFRLIK